MSLGSVTLERKRVEDLNAADYNPRTIDEESLDALETSIENFGVVEPIVWNSRTGVVVGGHQRLKVLRKKGVEETDVVVVDLPEDEERTLNVTLNSPFLRGKFDDKALRTLLQGLKETTPNFDALRLDDLGKRALKNLAAIARGRSQNEGKGRLFREFFVPPFSVLDARLGYWQSRKRDWISVLDSETDESREGVITWGSEAETDDPDFVRERIMTATAQPTSMFDPVLAEVVVRWFSSPGSEILDPFAGGIVRGAVAGILGREYVGIDLSNKQVAANEKVWEKIRDDQEEGTSRATWVAGDALEELPKFPDESFDLVFSCPPYFDLERYSDDGRDLSRMSVEKFWAAIGNTVEDCFAKLRDDRFAVFVVGEVRNPRTGVYRCLIPGTIQRFQDAGFTYHNEIVLVTQVASLSMRVRDGFRKTRKIGKTHQNVLVFVKGDARAATEFCGDVQVEPGEEES